jgi:hypothetical protein
VPAGIDIADDAYWAETGNYNAQVEQYRQEVDKFDSRITKNTTDITGNLYQIDPRTLDVTGTNPMSDVINAAIVAAADKGGIIVPPGVYNCDKPIIIPVKRSSENFTLIANGATFKASQTMTTVLDIGGAALTDSFSDGITIQGGTYDANWLADTCMYVKSTAYMGKLVDFNCLFALESYIKIGDGASTDWGSNTVLIANAKMYGTGDSDTRYTKFGIDSKDGDFKLSNIDIHNAQCGIESTGYFSADNLHIYSKGNIPSPRIAIEANAGCSISNIYPDWCDIGVSQSYKGVKNKASQRYNITNMFFYRPDITTPYSIITPMLLFINSIVKANNVQSVLVKSTYQNSAFSNATAFDKDDSYIGKNPMWSLGEPDSAWDNGFISAGNDISNRPPSYLALGDVSGDKNNGVIIGYIKNEFAYYDITIRSKNGEIDENICFNPITWKYIRHTDNSPLKIITNTRFVVGAPITVQHHGVSDNLIPIYLISDNDSNSININRMFIEVKSASQYFAPHAPWTAVPKIPAQSSTIFNILIGKQTI